MGGRSVLAAGRTASGLVACVPVTAVDGLDHLVAEAAVATATNGRYVAKCGSVVLVDSMSAPAGRHCVLCHADQPAGSARRRRW